LTAGTVLPQPELPQPVLPQVEQPVSQPQPQSPWHWNRALRLSNHSRSLWQRPHESQQSQLDPHEQDVVAQVLQTGAGV
jgi:hypothetical protein